MVNTCGGGSSSPAWLERPFRQPEEERIEGSDRLHHTPIWPPPNRPDGELAVVIAGTAELAQRRGPVPGRDRRIVWIGGYFGGHSPDDDQYFRRLCGSLPTSDIYDIVAMLSRSRFCQAVAMQQT